MKKTNSSRIKAALLHQRISDSLFLLEENSKVISMGDYNDNPNNKNMKYLTKDWYPYPSNYINQMGILFKKGIGSLAYKDHWFLFDQFLTSPGWENNLNLKIIGVKVFNPLFLRTPQGKYKGYPFRTLISGKELKGYSDHFPIYLLLAQEINK